MRLLFLALLIGCGKPASTPVATADTPEPAAAPAPAPTDAASPASDAPEAKRGLNDTFLDPELDVDKWVERFRAESREVVANQPAILAAIGLQPGEAVADIGAGTGLYLAPFAEAVGTEGTVYAVDISPKFLAHLETMATDGGYTQVQTVAASADSSNLEPGSVDAIFICDTYHHFEQPEATVAGLYAALKPGGRLFLLDFIREEGVSSEWIMDHVRAGQDVFAAEIQAAGFAEGVPVDAGLTENYMLRFDKPTK